MLELSTPVIRLWEGIIAVPLVGALDSARTQLVMEKLLETLVATGADHAMLDITGVSTVDTEVAQHLLKTVSAARLLGRSASSAVSGRRWRRRSCRSASSSVTSPPRRRWPTRWRTRCRAASDRAARAGRARPAAHRAAKPGPA